jgi:hypothetical protein
MWHVIAPTPGVSERKSQGTFKEPEDLEVAMQHGTNFSKISSQLFRTIPLEKLHQPRRR